MARVQTKARAAPKRLSGRHGAAKLTNKKGKQAPAAAGDATVRVKLKAAVPQGGHIVGRVQADRGCVH